MFNCTVPFTGFPLASVTLIPTLPVPLTIVSVELSFIVVAIGSTCTIALFSEAK